MFNKLILTGLLGLGSLLIAAPSAEALIIPRPYPGPYPGPLPGPFPGPYPGPFPGPFPGRTFRVEYRNPQWQQQIFFNQFAAQQFANLKRAQGYQVDVDRHGSHFHVRYRMVRWQLYRVVNNQRDARDLERFLERQGFDARVIR